MKIRHFIYTYTLGDDAGVTGILVAGILESQKKDKVLDVIMQEIKDSYQDNNDKYWKAVQSLQVVEA